MNLIGKSQIRRMNGNGRIWIHVEQCGLNYFNHLIPTGAVKCHLIVSNHDAEVTTEAANKIT